MSIAMDSAQKRKSNLETEMGKLALRIKQEEKTLSDLQVAYMWNDQMIKDLTTDEAIEKSKTREHPVTEEQK